MLCGAAGGPRQPRTMRHWCGAIGLAALLAGCATPQRPTAPVAGTGDAQARQTVHAYHGRFAVSYEDQTGQPRNAYGHFDWQQTYQSVKLQLLNPFGQTLAIIASAPGLATLELPNQAPRTAPSVSELMQGALGFPLPVEGLRYWLQPAVSPDSRASTSTDGTGRLSRIEQDGWTIEYLAYADAPASRVKRVNLTRPTPPLSVKLVLDQ
ncbi:lipoprotein insertase outer membrane protein LolB [Mycetohabitans sp. B8]|nr:lipoprotein insertase outer membrane protein LolB [Mycetohabitans sp. B8]